jgi:Bacterial PH domain
MSHDDFEFEPVRGLPAVLPEGERMVWQGAPDAIGLAIRAFHVRKVAVYFLLLMVWRFWSARTGGQDTGAAFGYALGILPLALAGIGVLSLIAWGYARTTVYTLTSKRLVMRSGIALPITLNLPFSKVIGVSFKNHPDGSGDIALKVPQDDRIAAMLVWPHMRPWSWSNPQPMLRSVPDAASVAKILMAELGEGAPADFQPSGRDGAITGISSGDRHLPVGVHA